MRAFTILAILGLAAARTMQEEEAAVTLPVEEEAETTEAEEKPEEPAFLSRGGPSHHDFMATHSKPEELEKAAEERQLGRKHGGWGGWGRGYGYGGWGYGGWGGYYGYPSYGYGYPAIYGYGYPAYGYGGYW
eukprot:Protomagalhaensia_wolfi_Nauph_80__4190@NODE_4267_length_604_cov_6_115044_g3397_i0_p1_GENE_NODE_4267_length_604_cov_6_115044_g3397_i0NODE_4267_length_604_cov_6_115044_g3397_i0_p1_ORF_typecomplete_len132_score36_58GRP/PF07172_11/2SGP/PF17228_2/7_9Keratin_2_head/PF16208_5/9_2_NODE_4267_length_604_cov_6_115044_g3397_i0166561